MPRTLLVVDDSATMQQAARLALTGEEWTVIGAPGLDDALDLLRSRQPDAVLCDARLGDADGYEACRSIRGTAEGASIPVILTGAEINESAALLAGAAGTLVKPFSSEDLSGTLSSTLDGGLFSVEDSTFAPSEPASSPVEASPTDAPVFETNRVPEWTPSAPVADDGVALEEVEIIDLATEDDFDDLEVLEDLPPLEPTPIPVEAPLDMGAAPAPGFAPLATGEATPEPETSFEFDLTLPGTEPPPEPVGEETFETGATVETGALGPLGGEPPLPDAPYGGEFDPISTQPADTPTAPIPLDLGPGAPEIEIMAQGEAPRPTPSPLELDLAGERLVPDKDDSLARTDEVEPPPLETPSETPPTFQPEPPTYGTEPPANFGASATEMTPPPGFDALFEEAVRAQEPAPAPPPPLEPQPDTLPANSPLASVVETNKTKPHEPTGDGPLGSTAAEPSENDVLDLPTWGTPIEPSSSAFEPGTPTPSPAAPIEAEVPFAFTAETTPEVPEYIPEPETEEISAETIPLDTAAVATAVRDALGASLSAEALAPLLQATVERIVWEVVPQLAERMIREAIERMKGAPPA